MKHIFLDMDGTLIDPREGFVNCVQYALRELGKGSVESRSLDQFIGPSLTVAFRALLPEADDGLIEKAVASYRERFVAVGYRESRICPGMADAIEQLARAGMPRSIVTVRATANARRILDHLNLTRYFGDIYGADLAQSQPDKALLIRQALDTEKLDASEAIMVGDRADDVRAARANRVRSVSVSWGFGSPEELLAAGPDHLVHSASELAKWLTDQ